MAGNPLQRVNPGDDFFDVVTADMLNAHTDAAAFFRSRQLNQSSEPLSFAPDPNIIMVRNDSAANRDLYDVLAITGIVFTPTENLRGFQNAPLFKGTLPTLADTGNFAMLLEPAGNVSGIKVAKAAVMGQWITKIQVDHVQHPYADIANGTARLTSNWYGAAKIIYKESSTGVKWAAVRLLGEMFRGPIEVIITQSGGIAPGSSGTAKVRWAGADASPTSTITVYHDWMEGASNAGQNKEAIVFWVPDRQKYVIYELQC